MPADPLVEGGAQALELHATPFHPQRKYQCGPAALATVLNSAGIAVQPEELVQEVYIPGRRGALQAELVAAARSRARLPYPIEPRLGALLLELQAGRPVLVLQELGPGPLTAWHYAVVVGYDLDTSQLVLRSGRERRKHMDMDRFMRTWQRSDHWALVLLRPGELPAGPDPARYLKAAAGLESVGHVAAAARAYEAALERWPQYAPAHFAAGNGARLRGDEAEAARHYRRALELDPTYDAARNNLAWLLAQRGCARKALDLLTPAGSKPLAADGFSETLEQTRADIHALDTPGPCMMPF